MQGENRGDLTRDMFKHYKHFSRVLSQQGRVQLDADSNEQTAILLHFLRSLAADLIGQHGGPASRCGFEIAAIEDVKNDFTIGPGHYYVDGILCEVEPSQAVSINLSKKGDNKNIVVTNPAATGVNFTKGEIVETSADDPGVCPQAHQIMELQGSKLTLAPAVSSKGTMMRHAITYKTQPDFLVAATGRLPTSDSANPKCFVYLDVWERHVTWVEDENIREVGLDGPDTATRAKVVCQVKTSPNVPTSIEDNSLSDPNWRTYIPEANLQPANRRLLKARVRPGRVSTDPCITSPKSSYRGAENQLYRWRSTSVVVSMRTSRRPSSGHVQRIGCVSHFQVERRSVTVENLCRDSRLGLNSETMLR